MGHRDAPEFIPRGEWLGLEEVVRDSYTKRMIKER